MININSNNFQENIKEGNSLVMFWGPNCTKCHALKPQLEDIEGDFSEINFFDVSIKDSRSLAKREGVSALPTLFHYRNGEKIKIIQGPYANIDDILDYLEGIDRNLLK